MTPSHQPQIGPAIVRVMIAMVVALSALLGSDSARRSFASGYGRPRAV